MNNSNSKKALQQPDYSLYPKLFSAVKNVENSVRLLAYDNMKLLQESNHFYSSFSLLTLSPLKHVLENSAPKHNISLYVEVDNHLSRFERILRPLRKEESLKEKVEEIYFLIYQALVELDNAELQLSFVIKTSSIMLFEDYLGSQIS